MGWRRGPGDDPDRTKRKGRTYIPTRDEMNEINKPARAAAEAKKNPPKVRKKRK